MEKKVIQTGGSFKPLMYAVAVATISLFCSSAFIVLFYLLLNGFPVVFPVTLYSLLPLLAAIALPFCLFLFYLKPFFTTDSMRDSAVYGLRIPSIPLISALVGTSALLLYSAFLFYRDLSLFDHRHQCVSFLLVALLYLLFTFLISALAIDVVNRVAVFHHRSLVDRACERSGLVLPVALFFFLTVFSGLLCITILGFPQLSVIIDSSSRELFCFSSLLIWGVILFGFYLFYLHPLRLLRGAIKKIERGVYNLPLPIGATNEIGKLIISINNLARSLRDKELVKDAFGQMVDPNIRDELLKGAICLRGESIEATALSVSLAQKSITYSKYESLDVLNITNHYYEKVAEAVESNNGLVQSYALHTVSALFGVPLVDPEHVDQAVGAAVAVCDSLAFMNKERKVRGEEQLVWSIGIDSGELGAGSIGASSLLRFGAVGNAVNRSARIEELGRLYRSKVLLSGESYRALENRDNFHIRNIDRIQFKGNESVIDIYEIYDCDSKKQIKIKKELEECFNNGITRYREGNFEDAIEIFDYCIKEMPWDYVSALYLKRCRRYVDNPPKHWLGITVVQSLFAVSFT